MTDNVSPPAAETVRPSCGSRPTRVAHAIQSLGAGGAQQVLKYLVAHGDRSSFEHRVYAGAGGEFHAEVARVGAAVRIIRRHVPKLDPVWIMQLAKAFREDGIQLLHTHLFGDSLHGSGAAQLVGGIPVVVTLHNSLQDFSAMQRLGYKWILRRAACVVACSHSAGESFRVLSERAVIHVIPNGLDPTIMPTVSATTTRAARDALGIPPKAVVVGAIGRLVAQKGFSYLLDAFRIVVDMAGTEVRLVLVGIGRDEARLRRQAEDCGLADKVSFLGFRADARELMLGFDILVFSSLYEGLPMTLLEGMASRRCIVTTAVSGLAEVVTDGENALLARPRDPEALAAALCRAIRDPDLRGRLGDRAHSTFQARYTVDRMVSQYEGLYRQVLAEDPTRHR